MSNVNSTIRRKQQTTTRPTASPRGRSPGRLGVSGSESSSDAGSRKKESRDESDHYGEERQQFSFNRDYSTSQRKSSTFGKLTYEMQQYQKLVADLEEILKLAGETPEAAWRARILVKSAQDTDKCLLDKLNAYEKSLLMNDTNHDLRTSQTACTKLHRDFKRSHKALITCLALYERRQKAEVNQLGAARWSSKSCGDTLEEEEEEDFFDRAMRQRELERMNESMRQVNAIYYGLAGLVDGQQENIDHLEREIDDAAVYVEAGAEEIHCFAGNRKTDMLCGAMDTPGCGDDDDDVAISLSDDKPSEGLRISEPFHWYMPFETIKEDMASVRNDIVMVGKDLVSKGKRLECGASRKSKSV